MKSSDVISRQDAIRKYQEVCNGIKCGECPFLIKFHTEKGSHIITDCKLEAFLHDLPSAQPKTGKWIPHREKSREYIGTVLVNVSYDYWFCDDCGYRVENGQPMYNFCPNCGADMRGGKHE